MNADVAVAYHEYLTRVLTLAAQTDTINEINWSLGFVEDRVTFVAEVGNLFSETEWESIPIGLSDVNNFEQALKDVGLATGGDFTYGPALYACRLRGQRPCNMGWPTDPRVSKLFEAAGPAGRPAGVQGMPPPPPMSERQFTTMMNALDAPTGGHARPEAMVETAIRAPVVAEPATDPVIVTSCGCIPETTVLTAGEGWPALVVDEAVPERP